MSDRNVLLLGFAVPESIWQRVVAWDAYPAVQTHKFAWSLARAFRSGFNSVFLLSSAPIQNYPVARKLFFGREKFSEQGMDGLCIGFVNALVLKHVTRFLSCLMVIPGIVRKRNIGWLVVHGVHSPFLLVGNIARLFGIRFAVVLTDLPGLVLPSDGRLARVLKRIDRRLVRLLLVRADAIVSLAPGLIGHFALRQPALVLPGILSSDFLASIEVHAESAREALVPEDEDVLMYAGGLQAAYGVDKLIDAVAGIDTPMVTLQLYGRGDQEQEIRRLCATDRRFFYGGFVGNDALVPAMLGVAALVNPRPTDELFSQMSFPSKLVEYLATGRPVITTRPPSIPQAYLAYLHLIEDESVLGIRKAIIDFLGAPRESREAAARSARQFVSDEISEASVGSKLVTLFDTAEKTQRLT